MAPKAAAAALLALLVLAGLFHVDAHVALQYPRPATRIGEFGVGRASPRVPLASRSLGHLLFYIARRASVMTSPDRCI